MTELGQSESPTEPPSSVRKRPPSRFAEFWMRRLRYLALTVLASGCMRPSAVWVEPGATVNALRFGIAQRLHGTASVADLQLVRVSACGVAKNERVVAEKVLWLASGSAVPEARHGSFAYGQAPTGLVTRQGPAPLGPGCYVIDISGEGISAAACFIVDAVGTITPSPQTVIECQLRDAAS